MLRFVVFGSAVEGAALADRLSRGGGPPEDRPKIAASAAPRIFDSPRFRFTVAYLPDDEHLVGRLAVEAATIDLVVVLIDAGSGITARTKLCCVVAALLGVRHMVLAVDRIDRMDEPQLVFDGIATDHSAFARRLDLESLAAIPVSSLHDINVTDGSRAFAWHEGPTLLSHLRTVQVDMADLRHPFRMRIDTISRAEPGLWASSGTIAAGSVAVGDGVVSAGSGQASVVERVVLARDAKKPPRRGDHVTLVLSGEKAPSQGDLLSSPADRPQVADQFAARVVWLHDDALVAGRPYVFAMGSKSVVGTVSEIKHRIEVDDLSERAAKDVPLNGIAVVNISLREPIAFDPYGKNRLTGGFRILDRLSGRTVGIGGFDFALHRAHNIQWQALDLTKTTRAHALRQRPAVLWFTGLSGAGKSTIANLVEQRLFAIGKHTYLLDGDNVRHGLNRDLGFTQADRVENIRRIAETAKLFVDAGLIVLCAFIAPFQSERRLARELVEIGEFIEIFVDAPLAVAEARDPKGLYQKARAGLIKNFTGIDSPYEPPAHPELHLHTDTAPAETLAEAVVDYLREHDYLG